MKNWTKAAIQFPCEKNHVDQWYFYITGSTASAASKNTYLHFNPLILSTILWYFQNYYRIVISLDRFVINKKIGKFQHLGSIIQADGMSSYKIDIKL